MMLPSIIWGQCDIRIESFDWSTGDFSLYVNNSINCGCNEYTEGGLPCESLAGPQSNNEEIQSLVFGMHIVGLDTAWNECVDNSNHDGWTFKFASYPFSMGLLTSGDVVDANVFDIWEYNNECWAEVMSHSDSLCTEFVIWQINLSQTLDTLDSVFGWATDVGDNQSIKYPDTQPWNNTASSCELPCIDVVDTIYNVINDTIVETQYLVYFETVYDTLYVELPQDTVYVTVTDTLIVNQLDTTYIQLPPITLYDTTYVYVDPDTLYINQLVTDTLFNYTTQHIDCFTGLPCDPCDYSVYVPNMFTPNGDGLNDEFCVEVDGYCWSELTMCIYDRWGRRVEVLDLITEECWDGIGHASGVYIWYIYGSSVETLYLSGHVGLFK